MPTISDSRLITLFCWGSGLVAFGFMLLMLYQSTAGQGGVFLTDKLLVVDTFAATERIPIDRIDLRQMQILDYRGSSPYRPVERISGSSGMREGLYYLRNGDRAYVSLRGQDPVLYLTTGKRISVIVRTADPSVLVCGILARQNAPIAELHPTLDPWIKRCGKHGSGTTQ